MLIAEANSLGPWLIAQNPAFPSVSPLVAQPSTDQEAGAEFTSTPHIHPCVSSEVLFDEQVSGSMPALGTPYASPVASLYEAWMQDPADSFDVPSHQGASLQQAMPPNHMDDDTSTDPHDIPSLENFHAGVPSTGEFNDAPCHSMTHDICLRHWNATLHIACIEHLGCEQYRCTATAIATGRKSMVCAGTLKQSCNTKQQHWFMTVSSAQQNMGSHSLPFCET